MFDHAEDNRDDIDGIVNAGAYILGRNMFGPGRGEWDLEWKGWWGSEPPYHAPVYVLTHHRREPLEMDGGTTFTFVTDGPRPRLRRPGGPRGTGGWRSRAAQGSACSTASPG
jgi:dihydrofolate reductase